MKVDRQAAPAHHVARARRSLGRWLGTLIGLTAVVRCGVAVMSMLLLGPLLGLGTSLLWAFLGAGPVVVEWLLSGFLVVAGVVIATRVRSAWFHRRAQAAGWFLVADTAVHVASIAVISAEYGVGDDGVGWFLAAIVIVNLALAAAAVVVIRKARSLPRIRHDLLRWQYVRKPRLADADEAW